MCVGCRTHFPKRELIRIVRTPAGDVVADAKGKTPGRGAYVCRKPECLMKARKSRALERMLSVTIGPETYDTLAAAVASDNG